MKHLKNKCHCIPVVTDPFCLQHSVGSVDQVKEQIQNHSSISGINIQSVFCGSVLVCTSKMHPCVCVRMYVLPGVDGVLSVVCHTLVRDLWLASSWPPLQHETSVQLHIQTVSLYIIDANKNGSFVLKGMTSDYLV